MKSVFMVGILQSMSFIAISWMCSVFFLVFLGGALFQYWICVVFFAFCLIPSNTFFAGLTRWVWPHRKYFLGTLAIVLNIGIIILILKYERGISEFPGANGLTYGLISLPLVLTLLSWGHLSKRFL